MTAFATRIAAMVTLLLDSGDITPQGARQIRHVLDVEQANPWY